MADIKITGYPELNATPDDADLLEIVDDVAGTPTSKKITVANLKAAAAAKGANADITSMTALTQITRATGGAFDIAIGGAAGDDFTVDTNKLVVEGDTGYIGFSIANPTVLFNAAGSVTLSGSGQAALFNAAITGPVGGEVRGMLITPTIVEAGSGNHPYFSSLEVRPPIITPGSATVGMASTVHITGAPSASGATNLALHVDAGDSIFDGDVGIRTAGSGNPLAVNRSADGIIVDFESADIVEGNIAIAGNTTSYNAFVGSHYTQLKPGQKELPIGAVVISTGEIIPCEVTIEKETKEETEILIGNAFEDVEYEENGEQIGEEFDRYEIKDEQVVEIKKPVYKKIKKIKRQLKTDHALDSKTGKIIKTITTKQNISPNVSGKEYFTYIDTTIKPANKTVYGVWFGKMSDDAKGMSFGKDDKPVYLIAQVGLFKVRVTDTQGDIEIGDFLESSSRLMEAQKQISKQKESGTIAKAMINVDWSKVTVDFELGYKWKLIPAIF